MSIEDVAEALGTELERTVYYGFIPDDADGTLDDIVALRDFPLSRPTHVFGEDLPARTEYGIAVHARYKNSQDDARTACQAAYEALLTMGYTALVPPVSLGKQDGRFEVVAQVAARQ